MRIILGVSGSVAAYRACDLARELMRQGHEVRVCLTDSAQNFVTPALFEALTGQPCLVDTFDEPDRGRMAHIDWARAADLVLVAPATANTLAKLAHGVADDMLTTLAVASQAPLMVVPAMNPTMYSSPGVLQARGILMDRGAEWLEPSTGDVACGENGQGKFPPIEVIVHEVQEVLSRSNQLAGQTVLISSGPTQEPIDIARYLTNRSSGKMGAALARAALRMGARVIVVAGPQRARLPVEAEIVPVQTAIEMRDRMVEMAPAADWIIGVAAVADYRPAAPSSVKIRRSAEPLHLELLPNPDVLAEAVAAARPGTRAIGFAAEVGDDPEVIAGKLERKNLSAIAINDVAGAETGFESETNQITLQFRDGERIASEKMSKSALARWLFEQALSRE